MPSILNSDDGVVSGTSGLKTTGGNDGLLNIQSNGSTVVAVTGSGISVTGTVSQTGVSTFAAGTVSAPSITFTGDTNTGIFSPAADTIAFTEGGVESMRIDASGNVGIGVTPSAWKSDYKAIQFSNSGAVFGTTGEALVGANVFVNSSDDNKYITTDEASMYRQANGNHIFYSAASGTAGNTITFTSVLSVNRNTTLVLQGGTSTSGTGIAFPATQSASSDANTLDDYEEGTWTPTVSKGTISPSNSGYRKIGSQVTVWTVINTFSDRTSADAVVVGGLPFTANTSFDDVCCGSAMWRYSNVDGGSVYLNSSNGLEFYAGTTNGEYTAVKHNSLNNGSAAVHLCATYITSA